VRALKRIQKSKTMCKIQDMTPKAHIKIRSSLDNDTWVLDYIFG